MTFISKHITEIMPKYMLWQPMKPLSLTHIKLFFYVYIYFFVYYM